MMCFFDTPRCQKCLKGGPICAGNAFSRKSLKIKREPLKEKFFSDKSCTRLKNTKPSVILANSFLNQRGIRNLKLLLRSLSPIITVHLQAK